MEQVIWNWICILALPLLVGAAVRLYAGSSQKRTLSQSLRRFYPYWLLSFQRTRPLMAANCTAY